MAEVLIIDDDIDSADALAEILRAEGHRVRAGFDGQEGLRLAREQMPDVALLDLEMPILDRPGHGLPDVRSQHGGSRRSRWSSSPESPT